MERGAKSSCIGERAEITRPVLAAQAGEFEPRDGIAKLDPNQKEAFVITETDVVLGAPLLDEPALEENSFGVTSDLVPLVVGSAVDQGASLDLGLCPP